MSPGGAGEATPKVKNAARMTAARRILVVAVETIDLWLMLPRDGEKETAESVKV